MIKSYRINDSRETMSHQYYCTRPFCQQTINRRLYSCFTLGIQCWCCLFCSSLKLKYLISINYFNDYTSSNNNILGFLNKTRAKANLCFYFKIISYKKKGLKINIFCYFSFSLDHHSNECHFRRILFDILHQILKWIHDNWLVLQHELIHLFFFENKKEIILLINISIIILNTNLMYKLHNHTQYCLQLTY